MFQLFFRSYKPLAALLLFAVACIACKKASVNFGEETLTDDPNIIYIDSMTVDMATYQTDSFYTAGDTVFVTGVHLDSFLGSYTATAFMQLGLPAINNLKDRDNCTFDSLVLIIRFYGSYYGDTTTAFTLKAHRMSEPIKEGSSIGYNTNAFAYDPTPLGSIAITAPRPSARRPVSLPLSQALGQQLFGMLNRNSDTITQADKFYKYFNGIALRGESAAKNSVYYFCNREPGSAAIMRLYYRENSITPQSLYTDFGISYRDYQFNNYTYDRTGTALAGFVAKKKQIIAAALTGNKSYLHGNGGLFPYFNIPSLFSIKELHPYVKVIKAELEITPPDFNYSNGSFYPLPPGLSLYTLDADNKISAGIYNNDGTPQTGSLTIDYLYHKDTRYTYDLTGYVNDILEHGRSYQKPLVLLPASRSYESRLILNAIKNNSAAKLKLYVLGL